MQHIDHLGGLGDRAEQRIVAELALLLAVEAHRRAIGGAIRADHRAIEVQREDLWRQGEQHQLAQQLLQGGYTLGIRAGQGAANGGHIGQALEVYHALDERVVRTVAQLPKLAIGRDDS